MATSVPSCVDPGVPFTYAIQLDGIGGTPQTTASIEVVFALDSSSNMVDNDAENIRLEASRDFVDQLDGARDFGGLVGLDSGTDSAFGLTQDFDQLKEHIGSVDAIGNTDLNVGLSRAIEMLDGSSNSEALKAIVIMTDGIGSYTNCNSGGPAATAAARGYAIYSVGLGPSADTNVLIDMATCTTGTFTPPAEADDLKSIFEPLLDQALLSNVPLNLTIIETVRSGAHLVVPIEMVPAQFGHRYAAVAVHPDRVAP